MNLHLRTAAAYAPNSCKESQGEDSKDELDDVDEEVSSSAFFCAASCLRLLAACLLKALAFAESCLREISWELASCWFYVSSVPYAGGIVD